MYLGTAWYPEQFPEAQWEQDLQKMRQCGMNVVRIAEYAWGRFEPREGEYNFSWLERAVDLAGRLGINVVMCTPSDAPPPWLTQKYPQVIRTDETGRPVDLVERRQFSPLSSCYRELSVGIATEMARRFGKHPNVIGWQVANEYCMYTYGETTRKQFQDWLAKRHGTLENFNQRLATAYWSFEYTDWAQIPMPTGWPHPGIDLEFFRFMTQAYRDFQDLQVKAIRQHADKRQWITHNAHSYENIDFSEIMESSDVVGWDAYPGEAPVNYGRVGWYSDYSRCMKSRQHWIMESNSGGDLRPLSWHYYAHGAEGLMFWQWRPDPGGQEQYFGGLCAADGNPNPRCAKLGQLGEEIRALAPKLANTRTEAQVAVLYSYADQHVIRKQRPHMEFDAFNHITEFYAPLRRLALDVDALRPDMPLDKCPLVVAPHLVCLDDQLVEKLVRYVQGGGHLFLGPRSGYKDQYNTLLPSRQPGKKLGELLGANVEELHTLNKPLEVSGSIGKGTASIWAETISLLAPDTEVLLRYGKNIGWHDDKPALVSRKVGKGRISYLGAWLDEQIMKEVMRWATSISGIHPLFPEPPQHVEVCRRVGTEGEIFFVINHGPETTELQLPRAMKDMLKAGKPGSKLMLEPYDVAILV